MTDGESGADPASPWGPTGAVAVREAGRWLRTALGPPPNGDVEVRRAALAAAGELYLGWAMSGGAIAVTDLTAALACAVLAGATVEQRAVPARGPRRDCDAARAGRVGGRRE
ncbi:hypothetical protein [Pseudosporangium ferrugineum]|uniref:hypothetical protein n=1 Tax=Pseudosporangium ferrugineum TaxID=439699 RepID=UPI0011B29A98|nr:hypothetical protein [Pseudosporangium ferrugineum]